MACDEGQSNLIYSAVPREEMHLPNLTKEKRTWSESLEKQTKLNGPEESKFEGEKILAV